MPSKNLGRVSIVPRGIWDANTSYNRLDAVVNEGSSWLAKKQSIGQRPEEDSVYWQLLAMRGSDGQQGKDGKPGEKGDPGDGFQVKGFYPTLQELKNNVLVPEPGDAYGVGGEAPYDIYIFDSVSGEWINNGVIQGPKGDTGETGPQGPKGDPGETGPQGPAGSDASVTLQNISNALGYTPGMTNPNLLDNPWFRVNQRGESVYDGVGHTVDRWQSINGSLNVTTNDDGSITLDNSSGSQTAYFLQKLEENNFPPGIYTISISVLSASGTPNQSGCYGGAYIRYGDTPVFSPHANISQSGAAIYSASSNITANINRAQVEIYAGCTITIKAVKLELGSVATLANDMVPNFAEELVKCQRYFFGIRKTGTGAVAIGVAATATSINFVIPIPNSLRTAGNASIESSVSSGNLKATINISDSGKNLSITGITAQTISENSIWISATVSGAAPGSPYYLRFDGSRAAPAYIAISKDL